MENFQNCNWWQFPRVLQETVSYRLPGHTKLVMVFSLSPDHPTISFLAHHWGADFDQLAGYPFEIEFSLLLRVLRRWHFMDHAECEKSAEIALRPAIAGDGALDPCVDRALF